jgi:phytoene dehydrogenase-like protein
MLEASGPKFRYLVAVAALEGALASLTGCQSESVTDVNPGGTSEALACDVAIVGGGPGGVHTAFRLTNPPGMPPEGVSGADKVCLFEKNARLGGRIEDVQFGPASTDLVGTGAYRLYDNQYTYALAVELGVVTVEPFAFSNLRALQDPGGNAGQFFGYNGDAFKAFYDQTSNDDDMWAELICGAQVTKDAEGHPDYASIAGIGTLNSYEYAEQVLGEMGARYLVDNSRFRADFSENVDAAGYMEFSATDYFGAGAVRYAVPGLSAIIDGMRKAIESAGGRIFLQDMVTSIAAVGDGTYRLETSQHSVTARQIVIATEHGALQRIGGDITASITARPEYQSVQSAKSLTVTHRWDRPWWRSDLRYPNPTSVVGEPLASDAPPILRADTTIMPDGYCLNSIEMPYTEHQDGLQVTRTVYSDQRVCLEKYVELYGDGGAAAEAQLNAEILRTLRILFPAVFDGSPTEPQATQTHVTQHGEAWYYLKKNALAKGVTNQSLFDWSVEPLAGEKVYLVGDAWHPLGSGWSNAAYLSSIRVLNAHFGMGLETHDLEPIVCGG